MIRQILESIDEARRFPRQVPEIEKIERMLTKRGWRPVTGWEQDIIGWQQDDPDQEVSVGRRTWKGPIAGMEIEITEEADGIPTGRELYSRSLVSVRINVRNVMSKGEEMPLFRGHGAGDYKVSELVDESVEGVLKAISRIQRDWDLNIVGGPAQ